MTPVRFGYQLSYAFENPREIASYFPALGRVASAQTPYAAIVPNGYRGEFIDAIDISERSVYQFPPGHPPRMLLLTGSDAGSFMLKAKLHRDARLENPFMEYVYQTQPTPIRLPDSVK